MAKFLLDGELGAKIPSVASSLAVMPKKKEVAPRKMLPDIQKGSALVTVNPDSGLGAGWSIYVDEYNLA